ncbi:MAG: hypothetical protein HYR94_30135 [Chloroflexi bacterium]|nr:hypothetical protein [Chloroflexota bacterium]
MPNETKAAFLKELSKRYGSIRKMEKSLSLYEIGEGAARIYIRYSKVHSKNQTFYGLREEDIQKLEGYLSFICFLWDSQIEPLFLPFSEYEDVFQSTSPAGDGQYKVQIYLKDDGTEFYIAGAGRFSVEAYFGWDKMEFGLDSAKLAPVAEFSHSQIQTFLGAIGAIKGYNVWIPQNDRAKLEWLLADRFEFCDILPYGFEPIVNILQEVDVIWIERGSGKLRALFEVEHSTPIYSGLLRFNDIHLVAPTFRPRYSIVANDARRSLFVRQINRPTFRMSGLGELCTFFEYADVVGWHNRVKSNSIRGINNVE